METSILNSIKKLLGLAADYAPFDEQILTFINSSLTNLHQLGIGLNSTLVIEDASTLWADLGLSNLELNKTKTYIFLKAKLLFDPPPTSFALDALKEQITEHEWRLTNFRDTNVDSFYETEVVP